MCKPPESGAVAMEKASNMAPIELDNATTSRECLSHAGQARIRAS